MYGEKTKAMLNRMSGRVSNIAHELEQNSAIGQKLIAEAMGIIHEMAKHDAYELRNYSDVTMSNDAEKMAASIVGVYASERARLVSLLDGDFLACFEAVIDSTLENELGRKPEMRAALLNLKEAYHKAMSYTQNATPEPDTDDAGSYASEPVFYLVFGPTAKESIPHFHKIPQPPGYLKQYWRDLLNNAPSQKERERIWERMPDELKTHSNNPARYWEETYGPFAEMAKGLENGEAMSMLDIAFYAKNVNTKYAPAFGELILAFGRDKYGPEKLA